MHNNVTADRDPVNNFRIGALRPKTLTLRDEFGLVAAAVERNPHSPELQFRFASLLFMMDRFDDTIDTLRGSLDAQRVGARGYRLLAMALLARETRDDSIAARAAARTAVELETDRYARSHALAILGKAHIRLGDDAEARSVLQDALVENVANKDAFKRLALLDLRSGRNQQACDDAEAFADRGIRHSRVLGIRPLALAMLGRFPEARQALGVEPFLRQVFPSAPSGWDSIDAFNRAVAEELRTHPGIRYDHYGMASAKTWRIEEPLLARSRLVRDLHEIVIREVEAYVASLPAGTDYWLAAMPREASLSSWCVMTDGDGFEHWHVHQNGWLSGAYYVQVPDFIVDGTGPEGCLSFGLPPDVVGPAVHEAFGVSHLRPRSGMLVLFPSHSWHRTFAHLRNERRICLAFDVAPNAVPA